MNNPPTTDIYPVTLYLPRDCKLYAPPGKWKRNPCGCVKVTYTREELKLALELAGVIVEQHDGDQVVWTQVLEATASVALDHDANRQTQYAQTPLTDVAVKGDA